MPSDWWQHVEINGPDECWPWLASVTSTGYPKIQRKGKNLRVHRLVVGATDPKRPVHHTCENRRCLNPAHLVETGSQHDHFQHHLRFGKTCKRGHDLTDPRNISYVRYPNRIQRICRPCDNMRERNRLRRLRAETA